jgi:hypothetical protein
MVYVGIDWSEKHHDVEVLDEQGRRLLNLRVPHGVEGLSKLQQALVELEANPEQVVVAVESDHGLLVNALVGSGYAVYPVNPKVAARYRERESVAGVKSDRRDAEVLANLVRTDHHKHRRLAGDSESALEVRVRARAHLRVIKTMGRLRNQLRSLLLEFYPAPAQLLAEDQLRDALAVLSLAPNPTLGRRLSLSKIEASLRRHGRERNVAERAKAIQQLLQAPQLELNLPRVVSAHSDETASLVRLLLQAAAERELLEEQLKTAFEIHPDAEIYLSFPGLAAVLGARVLAESGDDPARYPDAKARRNYAGNAPVTRASGKMRDVRIRVVRNRRLADAAFRWASSAVTSSQGARLYYERLRARGKTHNVAVRAVANRLVGMLHACIRDRRSYDELLAWPVSLIKAA